MKNYSLTFERYFVRNELYHGHIVLLLVFVFAEIVIELTLLDLLQEILMHLYLCTCNKCYQLLSDNILLSYKISFLS